MPQTYPLQPFVDALPIPQRRVVDEPGRLTIALRAALHRFHRDLPPSSVWTFDGTVPGPTIEVPRGVPLELRWENRLTGRLPVIVTVAPNATIDGVPVQATLGRSGGEPGHAPAGLSGYAVVHLHGARTYATARLDGEPRPRPVGARHLSQRPAGAAPIPRPRDGRDPIQRLRRPGRSLDRSMLGDRVLAADEPHRRHPPDPRPPRRLPGARPVRRDGPEGRRRGDGHGRDGDDRCRARRRIRHALDDNELGLKDTVRVNPNEVVDIVVRFNDFAGRFMYHCHILEHEDRDMMRPFVTMPGELMPFM